MHGKRRPHTAVFDFPRLSGTRLTFRKYASSQVCLSNKAILSFFDWRKQKRINFVNIREKSYDPSAHGGVLYEDAMRHLHVVDGPQVCVRAPLLMP
jgi:hypothetical protein